MMQLCAVKTIRFLGKEVQYVCQNENGPCPLLAICNVLLLRGHISLQDFCRDGFINTGDLIQVVLDRLLSSNPPVDSQDELLKLTQEKTLDDVMRLLPSLLVGLDVNVRFHDILDFEYTVALAVFDMLNIHLVHGWLLDHQDQDTIKVVENKSYNELVMALADYHAMLLTEGNTKTETAAVEETDTAQAEAAPSPSKATVQTLMRERQLSDSDAAKKASECLQQGPVIEEFLNSTASQLTYYGLLKLHEDIPERRLCVFFRNNHFSTMFKYQDDLFLLVTDAGYMDEASVVWEKLNEIDGDTEYFDENFHPSHQHHSKVSNDSGGRNANSPPEPTRQTYLDSTDTSNTSSTAEESAESTPLGPSVNDIPAELVVGEKEESDLLDSAPRKDICTVKCSSPGMPPTPQVVRVPSPVRTVSPPPIIQLPCDSGQSPAHRNPLATTPTPVSVPVSVGGSVADRSQVESAGAEFQLDHNGDPVLSPQEMEAQREAEKFYRQKKLNRVRQPATSSDDGGNDRDCCVM